MGPETLDLFDSLDEALRALGLNKEQLKSIKFSQKHLERPMDEWPMTYDPRINFAIDPEMPSLMRRYAVLKFALVDGPAANSAHVSEAFALISNEQVGALASEGLAYFSRQKDAAQKPRNIIPDIGMTMREFVMEYALRGDNRLLSALELWPGFGQYFSFTTGLDMKLRNDKYVYLDNRSLAYVTFRNYVKGPRKPNSH
jgi:hypothetical protein